MERKILFHKYFYFVLGQLSKFTEYIVKLKWVCYFCTHSHNPCSKNWSPSRLDTTQFALILSRARKLRSRQTSSLSTPVRPLAAGVGRYALSPATHRLQIAHHHVLTVSAVRVFVSESGTPDP
ncbi:hypothetical protein YC2023_055766 [Brassica napus]